MSASQSGSPASLQCSVQEEQRGCTIDEEREVKRARVTTEFTVMQFNMLADGLADDGFLTPRMNETAEDFGCRVKEVKRMKEQGLTPANAEKVAEHEHLKQIIDLDNRLLALVDLFKGCDVAVVEECDFLADLQKRLPEFTCGNEYVESVDTNYKRRLDALASKGVAFAPKQNSTARKLKTKKSGSSGRSSGDDGTAVFWKRGVFELVGVEHCIMDEKQDAAALGVHLRHIASAKNFLVIGAHLPSGEEKEDRRHMCMQQIHDGLIKTHSQLPIIFAGDVNSDIFRPKPSCFSIMTNPEPEGWGFQSVWGSMEGDKVMASVFKMRGPASDQPKKIGEMSIETIDHVCVSKGLAVQLDMDAMDMLAPSPPLLGEGDRFQLKQCENSMMLFQKMLPRQTLPSDHYPIFARVTLE